MRSSWRIHDFGDEVILERATASAMDDRGTSSFELESLLRRGAEGLDLPLRNTLLDVHGALFGRCAVVRAASLFDVVSADLSAAASSGRRAARR
jgi:hypothetical protein